jgi:uncharacterized membrane protein YbhN (UPF0104 family)
MYMGNFKNNRFYKVISLFIKAIILIAAFAYIFYKLQQNTYRLDLLFTSLQIDWFLLLLSFILLFLNWGLEAIKWQRLVAPLEMISFPTALKSVFAGVTVSIFMPNRVGEFAARIFFLEKADKVKATLKNFVGNSAQLLITLLAGSIAIHLFIIHQNQSLPFLNESVFKIMGALFLVFLLSLLFLYRFRNSFSEKINSYLQTIFTISKKEITIVLLLSLVRYIVFVLQYFLILKALYLPITIGFGITAIAIIFLITSIIPSFAFTEIITRGAAAAYVFNSLEHSADIVVLASFILWVINLAIPALIGSVFISKLNFFKQANE